MNRGTILDGLIDMVAAFVATIVVFFPMIVIELIRYG